MDIIISFAGLKAISSPTPYALQRMAGSTILGHILVHLLDLSFNQLVLILETGQEEVERWVQENAPELSFRALVVPDAEDPLAALKTCSNRLTADPALFIAGNYIAEARYWELVSAAADVCCLLQSEQDQIPAEDLGVDEAGFFAPDSQHTIRWAGSCWFKHGSDLAAVLAVAEEPTPAWLRQVLAGLARSGKQISTRRAVYCLDTRSVESTLYANARLLRLNHGSENAIERSYAEDFTVLPPVFLHETAIIENAVIGPFVNLEAHAAVRNSIVRNSLIGAGAQITDAILDESLIGDNAVINGRRSKLVVESEAKVEFSAKDE